VVFAVDGVELTAADVDRAIAVLDANDAAPASGSTWPGDPSAPAARELLMRHSDNGRGNSFTRLATAIAKSKVSDVWLQAFELDGRHALYPEVQSMARELRAMRAAWRELITKRPPR
jgi:hypothetical protein